MIDCHRHFMFGKARLPALVEQLRRDGIDRTVLFGYHGLKLFDEPHRQDAQVARFFAEHPTRIIPFFCDFDFYAPDALDYAGRQARGGVFRGLGEVLLGHAPIRDACFPGRRMTDPEPVAVFRLMGEWGLPVLAHADPEFFEDMRQVLALCPETDFIWAHIAYDFPAPYGGTCREPPEIEALLDRHPNLYFDISHWKISPIYLCEGAGQALLERRSDRFLFGADMSEDYLTEAAWLGAYRRILEGLSPGARASISGENLEKLLSGRRSQA